MSTSISEMLRNRSDQSPDDVAYTFFDYDQDPAGFVETLTWSEVHRRARVVAAQISRSGSPGDRAAILAPQGLDYIVSYFGAIEAGFIAVPLPVPSPGGLDERAAGAIRDCSPAVILTTSAVVGNVMDYAHANPDGTVPVVIEVDAVDFDVPPELLAPGMFHETAYLQYTSGSTGQPAGVVISHQNVISNLGQIGSDYFEHLDGVPPRDLTMVSWLPFYHDMGLIAGLLAPLGFEGTAVLMSPMAFLQKPARWLQHIATRPDALTAAPNFAFDLAARRSSDADLAGLDFSRVLGINSGSERIHPSTVRRFNERLGPYGLPNWALKSSYGLAEATLYVVTSASRKSPMMVRLDVEKLAAGYAEESSGAGADLVGCGVPRSSSVRIVDPETRVELPAGAVGEIWVQGGQVAKGYWRNPKLSERTFGGQLAQPAAGTSAGNPGGRWLRTGDLGVLYKDELFVVGRIKDLLIVDGRNHYPDDIEATISAVTGGRVAAVSIPDESGEKLVAIAELKSPGVAPEDLPDTQRRVAAAVRDTHGVRVGDLVLVGPGSLPITTSGKVRRSTCAERYQAAQFSRLDALV